VFGPSLRGTAIFSPQELDQIVRTTVIPETDNQHHFALVAATSQTGIEAALVYGRAVGAATWQLQAAWQYTFGAGAEAGAKLILKF
jgi:hypothetical protein